MVSFKSLIVLCSAAVAFAAPAANVTVDARGTDAAQITIYNSATGYVGNNYYSLWEQVNSGVTMNINNGQYSLSWNQASQNVVGGIGWNPGSAHTINYSGSFNPNGQNAYLSLYGWTTGPLVEYYICENFGSYNPSTGLQHLGTVYSDGSNYDIYKTTRVNAPSIQGTATFGQYWSVRQNKRTGGTITIGNHFNAWKNLGMNLGQHNYQILATEGYQSYGSSSISV
ncbi:glycoside hydrolase, partial [Agrocybe pediades]